MSTRLRQWSLRLYRWIGIRHVCRRSVFGQPFICHVGDFGSEIPVYNEAHSLNEIAIMAAWASQFDGPQIVDVGGNVGFIASQIALLVRDREPHVYVLEPVPSTYAKLVTSIRRLGLTDLVSPLCCALGGNPHFATIWFSDRESLFAQISAHKPPARVGAESTWTAVLTIDLLATAIGRPICLIKVDVEGLEASVFEGANHILADAHRPALCFELNPITLREAGRSTGDLTRMLHGYELYYVDDFEGGRYPFGTALTSIDDIDWVCNVFAVPANVEGVGRWQRAVESARTRLHALDCHRGESAIRRRIPRQASPVAAKS